jgi:hypothetical protein
MLAVYLRFPNRQTADNVLRLLLGTPKDEEVGTDGYIDGHYANIDIVFGDGQVSATGNPGQKRTGYHVNLLIDITADEVPPALQQYLVVPAHPICKFG